MNTKKRAQSAVAMWMLTAALSFAAPPVHAQGNGNGDVIVDWNQLAQIHIAGPPFSQARQYAMLHVAMADAVVAIDRRYQPFRFPVVGPQGASADAAAAR